MTAAAVGLNGDGRYFTVEIDEERMSIVQLSYVKEHKVSMMAFAKILNNLLETVKIDVAAIEHINSPDSLVTR